MKTRLAVKMCPMLLILFADLSQLTAHGRLSQPVPRSAMVTVRLLKAPGLNLPGSKWEIAYEFRIMPESLLWSERGKLNDSSTEHAGELIKKASMEKSLETSVSQTLSLQIPFDTNTLSKLRNQPADRLAPGHETKSQIFVFYAVVSVHDSKLKKTVILPISRIWDYANFPDARFEVTVEINDDSSYYIRSSSIKSPGITIRKTK